MGKYPVILGGDHAAYEAEWEASGKPLNERSDWPLPSFDARDWAEAFCKIATDHGYKNPEGKPLEVDWMTTWFANALMRGYDQRTSEVLAVDVIREPDIMERLRSTSPYLHGSSAERAMAEAAAEIEGLRLRVKDLEINSPAQDALKEIERLRAFEWAWQNLSRDLREFMTTEAPEWARAALEPKP